MKPSERFKELMKGKEEYEKEVRQGFQTWIKKYDANKALKQLDKEYVEKKNKDMAKYYYALYKSIGKGYIKISEVEEMIGVFKNTDCKNMEIYICYNNPKKVPGDVCFVINRILIELKQKLKDRK